MYFFGLEVTLNGHEFLPARKGDGAEVNDLAGDESIFFSHRITFLRNFFSHRKHVTDTNAIYTFFENYARKLYSQYILSIVADFIETTRETFNRNRFHRNYARNSHSEKLA